MSKTAIKSPTKKKPNQPFFTCMMRAYKHVPTDESGFEMAVFYDTVGHRAMMVAWVRELCGQQVLGRVNWLRFLSDYSNIYGIAISQRHFDYLAWDKRKRIRPWPFRAKLHMICTSLMHCQV